MDYENYLRNKTKLNFMVTKNIFEKINKTVNIKRLEGRIIKI